MTTSGRSRLSPSGAAPWIRALALLAMVMPVGVSAQSGEGFWYGLDVGGGYLSGSCDDCEESSEWGFVWGLHGGGQVSPTLAWGVEGLGFVSSGWGEPWLGSAGALIRWSPEGGQGVFLKGGLGWAWYKGLVPVGRTAPSADGFQLNGDVGWDFQSRSGARISPFVGVLFVPGSTLDPGSDGGDPRDVSAYLLRAGVSLSRF